MHPAAPWQSAYPPGLAADAELPVFPIDVIPECAAAEWGDKTAIEFRGREISHAELARKVKAAAAGFVELGVKPGDRVALLLPNTPWHPVAFFGALKAGAVIVHLSPLDAPRILQHKLTDSGARLLVTTDTDGLAKMAEQLLAEGFVEKLVIGEDAVWSVGDSGPQPVTHEHAAAPGMVRWNALPEQSEPHPALPHLSLDDIALLQYTGGTTGMPKAAMLTHRNLSAAISAYDLWSDAWDLLRRGEERVLLYLPLFHIYGLTTCLLRGLRNGHTILLRTRFDPESALDEIEAGATAFPGVPTMWVAICNTPGFESRDLCSLRLSASGGAPMPVDVAKRFAAKTGLELRGGWGMSETSPAGTNLPPGRPEKTGTIGIPLPGISVRVVDVNHPRKALAPNQTGELAIRGPNVMAGYYNRPEESAACFADGWFLTGDIGHMDEDGFFTISDRKKDMIICGGFNVYPQMIEQAIYEHPDVEEVLVIGISDPYRGEAAKAFVKLKAGASRLSLEELRSFLKRRVGPHELPAALELRDALPRTPVGKLSKLELKQEEAARAQTAKAS
jgi:long-chain acyl-CoA synthetase